MVSGPVSQQPIPSPSGFTAPSPANPVGSVGSPFPSVHSPMGVGSPGLNRPSPRPGMSPNPGSVSSHHAAMQQDRSSSSRVLPQRLWAGANPTPLTHKAFDEMCRPCPLSPPTPNVSVPTNVNLSPLHRFLGCVFLRRYLQQVCSFCASNERPNQGNYAVGNHGAICAIKARNYQ